MFKKLKDKMRAAAQRQRLSMGEKLFDAAAQRQEGRVRKLLKQNADPDYEGGLALLLAISQNNKSLFNLLADAGADLRIDKDRPLRQAILENKQDMAAELCSRGACLETALAHATPAEQPRIEKWISRNREALSR